VKVDHWLHHQNGLVRKGTIAVLQVPRYVRAWTRKADELENNPPVLANSFPKSGTHLLEQITSAVPGSQNYGIFLSSMTSSYRFLERGEADTLRIIRSFQAGELIRGHLFHAESYERRLCERKVVHYFIYRDPRDVALSEAHYLRSINRWHKLHPYFRDVPKLEDAITLAIRGMAEQYPELNFPNIGQRFGRYAPWLDSSAVCSVRFEDLVGENRDIEIQRLADFYVQHTVNSIDAETLAEKMRGNIAPERSHTFRKGRSGGWRQQFTLEHRKLFQEITGNLLVQLGYEQDDDWVEREPNSSLPSQTIAKT